MRHKLARRGDNILTDILLDCFGRPMSVQSSEVPGRSVNRSRYYMSRQTVWGKRQQLKRLRARADATEDLVISAVRNFIGSREQVRSFLLRLSFCDSELDRLSRRCHEAANRFGNIRRGDLRHVLQALIVRIELSLERVKIVMRLSEVERFIRWDGIGLFGSQNAEWAHSSTHLIDVPAGAIRYSSLLAMPVEPKLPRVGAHPSPGLKRLIGQARELQSLVDTERDKTLAELAATLDWTPSRFARVLRLNYLAPDILLSILDGTCPKSLSQTKLVQATLPMDWALQRQLLGFPPRPSPEGGE
ncbi:hypothetical protein LZ496_13795 [Sphingomonas sp. NSE70-1]|uniref:Uncharacterized protein n=1 Tax=Sphingomonas caseinilyticus TaxID=2908205 RepID=A0ABT0RYG8_9SPHN|nr:hypothetical protein [Sphingomonas caseinilyticus]MCL6699848.1 hypothetical protein [Sphingomonas caseinilyticus]